MSGVPSPPAPPESPLARAFWLHPLLAGVAPALLTFRQARDLLGPFDSWPLLVLLSATGALLLGGFGLLFRNRHLAAVAATLVLVALHLAPGLPERLWPAAWAGVALAVAGLFFLRRVRVTWPTALANLFVLLWTGFGIWQCVVDGRGALRAPVIVERPVPAVAPRPTPDQRPDVYVLLLDGYGRADLVERSQGFRPALAGALADRGFWVGTEAMSPHAQTALSSAALFGLEPVDALVAKTAGTSSRRPLRQILNDGAAARLLRAGGYRIVTAPGEFAGSRLPSADERRFAGCILDEYDYFLIAATALPTLLDWAGFEPHAPPHAHRRHCLRTQLERLAEPVEGDRPVFFFTHLVAPHPPFVFRPDGSARPTRAGTLSDGPGFHPTEIYSAGYHDMTAWLDRVVPETIDRIRAGARRPPIILVLGDHGAGNDLEWANPTDAQLRERMGVLLALLAPDEVLRELDPATGPVNVMRRVVSHVTGAPLPPLPERALFSAWQDPYGFRDVTAIVRAPREPAAVPVAGEAR